MTRHSRRSFGLGLFALGLGACRRRSGAAEPPRDAVAPSTEVVEIDVRSSIGSFDQLSGVQGSPAPIVQGEPDLTAGFRQARIAASRFPQDCYPNTLTLGGVFPDENADPDAPASYRFEAIDRHVKAARAAGARVLWQSSYDVGRSDRWVDPNLGGRAPVDVKRWGRVVTRCLEHFNNGWSGGLERAVADVEIVNEPNGLGGFNGVHAERLLPFLLEFLDVVARYNLSHPETKVRAIAPGIPLSITEWPEWKPRFDAALSKLRAAGKELPVWSFHTYGGDVSPLANERLARELRALLDHRGFGSTELWNTEWQAGDFLRKHLRVDRERAAAASTEEQRAYASAFAAYAVACKLRWQGLVRGSFYYRANVRAFPDGFKPPIAGKGLARFFGPDGRLGPLALQEQLLARAAEATPERCLTRFTDDGLFVARGLRSADSRTLSVLLSNLSPRPRNVALRFVGAGSASTRARAVALDGSADLAPRDLPPAVADGDGVTLEVEIGRLACAWVVVDR